MCFLSGNFSFSFNVVMEAKVFVYCEAKDFCGVSDGDADRIREDGALEERVGNIVFGVEVSSRGFVRVRVY